MDQQQLEKVNDRRLLLDAELRTLQEEDHGYQHTYFEPPESIRMSYDAVVYEKLAMEVRRANNRSYNIRDGYFVTVISRDPETTMPRRFQEHFERCRPERPFVQDNLYHFPFTLYY